MTVIIRLLAPEETRAFLEVHRAAVHGTAAADYPAAVIDAWAPFPVVEADVEEAGANADGAIKIVAVVDGKIVGIGEVAPAARELNACYVLPRSGGTGVGKAIVSELESIARAHGAPFLALASSLTAQAFYSALGYKVLEHGEHVLRSGARMACVRMRKEL